MAPRKERGSPPTIRDVAERSGVSPATVSRVLNNYPFIRPEVRDRVLEGIATLGYKRNRVAQRLRATSSLMIGIIVADITNPFLNTIMSKVEAVFFDRGYSVLMSNTGSDAEKELGYLSMMENEEIAGLVIVPHSDNVHRVSELAARGLPVVVIDRRMTDPHLDCVLSDNVGGARSAVEHLIGLGHTRIGHIGGPVRVASGRERLQGYRQAMKDASLPVDDCWVRFGNHKFESGYDNTLKLLKNCPELTALFIENDMMTLGALRALQESGLRVPEDVALVGFDDAPWSQVVDPPLTVVAQNTAEIGSRAAARLIERIEEPTLPSRIEVLETSLKIRVSSGARAAHP